MLSIEKAQDFIAHHGLDIELQAPLNSGSFGTVFVGRYRGDKVAVKVERITKHDIESLKVEYQVYCALHRKSKQDSRRYIGVPRALCYYDDANYRLLALPFYGHNLKDLMRMMPKRRFSPATVALIALQVLAHLEFMHERGFVHRDIKPANLVIGRNRGYDRACIYLVDLGLSKSWRHSDGHGGGHHHIVYKRYKGVTGTPRFMGVHAHERHEASRRDDLQALSYTLVYFLIGRLPWQDLLLQLKKHSKATSAPPLSRREQRQQIYVMKRDTPSTQLCHGFPAVFSQFLDYARGLGFDERPDYERVQRDFFRFLVEEYGHVKYEFDWMLLHPDVVSETPPTCANADSDPSPEDDGEDGEENEDATTSNHPHPHSRHRSNHPHLQQHQHRHFRQQEEHKTLVPATDNSASTFHNYQQQSLGVATRQRRPFFPDDQQSLSNSVDE